MRIFHSIDFAVYTRSNNKAIGCFRSRPKDSLWVTGRVDTPKDFSIIWIQCRNRMASDTASFSVPVPLFTGMTSAPSSRMR